MKQLKYAVIQVLDAGSECAVGSVAVVGS